MNRCPLFPDNYLFSEPICKAGSDVAGLREEDPICSEEYAETCRWFNEYMDEAARLAAESK